MSNGSGKNTRYCHDCSVRFTIYARRVKRKYFCPICGDTVAVTEYAKRTEKLPRKPWTTLEELKLKELLDNGYRPKELASRFGRTETAMRKKAARLGYKFD